MYKTVFFKQRMAVLLVLMDCCSLPLYELLNDNLICKWDSKEYNVITHLQMKIEQ